MMLKPEQSWEFLILRKNFQERKIVPIDVFIFILVGWHARAMTSYYQIPEVRVSVELKQKIFFKDPVLERQTKGRMVGG